MLRRARRDTHRPARPVTGPAARRHLGPGAGPGTGTARARRWGALATTWAVCGAGVLVYLQSSAHAAHDPEHSLQQLDLLYLDEPAPLSAELGLQPGRPWLIVVCTTCRPPGPLPSRVRVVVTDDRAAAVAYGLATEDGRAGPGYALVDSRGRLRYRTFDPAVQDHALEVGILVDALP